MPKTMLVIIDFQKDFLLPDGKLTIDDMPLVERMEFFSSRLKPDMFDDVLVSFDTHFPENYNISTEGQDFPMHCIYGTEGWKQAVDFSHLNPIPVMKFTTDIWHDKELYPILNEDLKGSCIFMGGVCTDICVEQCALGFLNRGARVIIFEDLVKGLNYQLDIMMANYPQFVNNKQLCKMTSREFLKNYVHDTQKCLKNEMERTI